MYKKLIKYLYLFHFFLFCLNIHSNILLDENDKLQIPLPLPYNGITYTKDEINNFIDDAIKNNKRPILIFGANWCPDCRIFSGTMDIPKIKSFINENFNVMYVDVKRYEINMTLLKEFDIPYSEGIPRVLVFDEKRNILNNSNTTEWRTARDRSSQEIFNFFQSMSFIN